jgi:ribosomal protein S8
MFNKCKKALLQIVVAQKKKKKLLSLRLVKAYIQIYNLLWEEGYIYGYTINLGLCIIIIKASKKEILTLQRVHFLPYSKKYIKLREFSNYNKNIRFFIINDKGCLKKNKCLGGKIILL